MFYKKNNFIFQIFGMLCFVSQISFSAVCPPFTGSVAQFCNLNIADQVCVGGNLIVAGNLIGGDWGYANTLVVDKDGDDSIATRANKLHFATISAALAQALPGDVVWVFQGVYEESITIPDGVYLLGNGMPTIQQLNVTQATDLVTMGSGTQLNSFRLVLSAAADVQLRGIVIAGIEGVAIFQSTVTVVAVNSAFNAEPTYGIAYANSGASNIDSILVVNSTVLSTGGSGQKRALYLDKSNRRLITSNCSYSAFGPINTIGIEVNEPSASVTIGSCLVQGDNADVSQTQGLIELNSTDLVHSNANTFAFSTTIYPSSFIWATADPIPAGTTRYLRPGTAILNTIPSPILATQKFLAKAMTIHVETAPGLGESTEFRVMRKVPLGSAQPTQLFGTLTDATDTLVVDNLSVHFDGGDEMSIRVTSSAGAVTAAATVVIDIY